MTLNEMLGAVVGQLQSQESTLNAADPQHPQHGTELLSKFQAAQAAAPTDPNADLGDAFAQVSSAMSAQGNGFTAKSYGDAFAAGSQAFAGRPNQLSMNDLAPILGALTKGFGNHDTRGAGVAGPLAAIAPVLGMLTCGYLMSGLPVDTWLRLVAWLAAGTVVYVAYGRTHSKAQLRLRADSAAR